MRIITILNFCNLFRKWLFLVVLEEIGVLVAIGEVIVRGVEYIHLNYIL